jgi:AcrR family transcriptional regulator
MIEKRGRGRPRREGADEEILRATRELLERFGYAAFTTDLVADRTGIAKTTIYRRWPTRGALVAAAIDDPSKTSLDEIETVLSILDPIDTDAVEIIRTILTSRRGHLSDAAIGKLLVKLLLHDGPTGR